MHVAATSTTAQLTFTHFWLFYFLFFWMLRCVRPCPGSKKCETRPERALRCGVVGHLGHGLRFPSTNGARRPKGQQGPGLDPRPSSGPGYFSSKTCPNQKLLLLFVTTKTPIKTQPLLASSKLAIFDAPIRPVPAARAQITVRIAWVLALWFKCRRATPPPW